MKLENCNKRELLVIYYRQQTVLEALEQRYKMVCESYKIYRESVEKGAKHD